MARAVRKVVQVELLRDQVYQLIRDDLNGGLFIPGQRIIEAELAARYEVSRTPVREALFQLSREGVLTAAGERGYEVPVDTREKALARQEVRDLLDPALVRHSATDGTAEQRRQIAKVIEKMQAAHEAGKLSKFIEANFAYRKLLREMCGNDLLARCFGLVDDQAQLVRRNIFADPEPRSVEMQFSAALVDAVVKGDADEAEKVMRASIAHARKWAGLTLS